MIAFLTGLTIGALAGYVLACLLRANDDDCSRGHPA